MTTQQKIEKLKSYIKYWEARDNWCICAQEDERGNHCAIGHVYKMDYGTAYYGSGTNHLRETISDLIPLMLANNGDHVAYNQSTPKQRTLAWAYDKLRELESQLPTINKDARVTTNLPFPQDDNLGDESDLQHMDRITQ